MAFLNKILSKGTWAELVAKINDNFAKLNQEVQKKETTLKIPLFSTVEEAKTHIKEPYTGQLIYVGNSLPAKVYKWSGTAWTDTKSTGGSASVSLTDYYTKAETDNMKEFVKNTNEVVI